jgi:general secretion pathway protein D
MALLRRWSAIAALLLACGAPGSAQAAPASEASLNFVGVDIDTVIKAVGHYTGIEFIIDPRVRGTMNLVSDRPVSKSQSFQLLTTALRMHGYAVVVGENGLTKVVPEADAKLQAGLASADGIRGDQLATQIFRLNYESSVSMVNVLKPLISANNTISANPGNNSLVITDYADNLRRLRKIIAILDTPPNAETDVVQIRHAVAGDVAAMANRMLETEQGGDGPRVVLFPDARTNSVFIRAPSPSRAALAKSLIAKLDQPTAQDGNFHIVELQNADAVKLAQTLRTLVSADMSAALPAGTQQQAQPRQGGPAAGAQAASATAAAPQASASAPGGPTAFIQADPATNTLIIVASDPVYRNLRAVIDRLDARRSQVYVESLIVEVSAETAADLGVQWVGVSGDSTSRYRAGALTSFGSGGNNLINLAAGAASGDGLDLLPGNGLSFGVVRQSNGRITLGALARALETQSGANILSMPNLITLDNEEARMIVGKNVPLITGQYATNASGGASGVNPFQTIERKDIGLSLRIRPQISQGGSVKMAIYQETSDVLTEGVSGITTSKRAIDTNVLVNDGQIVVLGGLIEDSMQDGKEKVPGLGDIPVLGNLFKYQSRKHAKTNLLVFLRPTVVRSNDDSVILSGDRYNYMRNARADAQRQSASLLPRVDMPELPPLQEGRPSAGTEESAAPPAKAPGARYRCRIPRQKPADNS